MKIQPSGRCPCWRESLVTIRCRKKSRALQQSIRAVFISPVVDPASGTVRVRLEIPNPDHQLRSGLLCVPQASDAAETE